MILAIDPGTTRSAYVFLDGMHVAAHGLKDNDALRLIIQRSGADFLVIERIAAYGMAVGREVFETAEWCGRFAEVAYGMDVPHWWMYRRDVKLHLCGSPRAKDGNVRIALLDKFPRTGGGKVPQIGTKSRPGPLYGVRKDIWAALGVAVTFAETRGRATA